MAKNELRAITREERLLKAIITGEIDDTIEARSKKEELLKRLMEKNIEKDINDKILGITNPQQCDYPIITFIDDDGKSDFITKWKPVCDSNGFKVTLAVIPSNVGSDAGFMTEQQILDLRDDGYDFASHTYTHSKETFNTAQDKATSEQIQMEFKDSQDWMKERCLCGYDHIVYPYSSKAFLKQAKEYYTIGVNSSSSTYNNSPNNNIYLERVFLQSDQKNVATVKGIIDTLVNTNGWLIIGTHSNVITQAEIVDVVNYINSKNIKIMTLSEALKYKKNVLSCGDYNSSNKLYVGYNGAVESTTCKTGSVSILDSAWQINQDSLVGVKESNGSVSGNIAISNIATNGNLVWNTKYVKISGVTLPSKKVVLTNCIIQRTTGAVEKAIMTLDVDGSIIGLSSVTGDKIRFLYINFIY